MEPIEPKKQEILSICKTRSIKSLYIIGSASRGDDLSDSDVDLLVAFAPSDNPFEQYMGAKEDFESLFNRRVDLIEEGAIKNPFFKQSINEDKVLIYEER